jgi:ATP-dependent Clp protease adaptor protein ClpS
MNTDPKTFSSAIEQVIKEKALVLYNDDFNTFDFVIETLVELCGHDPVQAEQCAYIVHYKGKCDVKHGVYEELEPICSELLRRGLTAKIVD